MRTVNGAEAITARKRNMALKAILCRATRRKVIKRRAIKHKATSATDINNTVSKRPRAALDSNARPVAQMVPTAQAARKASAATSLNLLIARAEAADLDMINLRAVTTQRTQAQEAPIGKTEACAPAARTRQNLLKPPAKAGGFFYKFRNKFLNARGSVSRVLFSALLRLGDHSSRAFITESLVQHTRAIR